MLSIPMTILLVYVAAISLVSVVICFYDKKISKRNNVKLRIPEATLLGLSAAGGSVVMYLCMLAIRHKTKHNKFMVGIPVIIVLQAVLIGYLISSGILPVLA